MHGEFYQYIISGTFSILESRQRALGDMLETSHPEKPTGAKTMSTLHYVIEGNASTGNISQSIKGYFTK